jgi:hypothetical protein
MPVLLITGLRWSALAACAPEFGVTVIVKLTSLPETLAFRCWTTSLREHHGDELMIGAANLFALVYQKGRGSVGLVHVPL